MAAQLLQVCEGTDNIGYLSSMDSPTTLSINIGATQAQQQPGNPSPHSSLSQHNTNMK